MNNQANKKRLDQEAKEAAETVARLGIELPAGALQRIYDEVVFDLAAKTKLAAKMKGLRPGEHSLTRSPPAEEKPGQ